MIGSTSAWSGGQVTATAYCVLAPNPGPMTLDGTNTWIIGSADTDELVVIDPGPDDPAHLEALVQVATSREARITTILLTHGHRDHSAGTGSLVDRGAAQVRALAPTLCLAADPLRPGEICNLAGVELEVIATPGHSSDSASFIVRWAEAENPAPANSTPANSTPAASTPAANTSTASAIVTGDTVLGRGTTVIAYPDGTLGAYLSSLRQLAELASSTGIHRVLPGHGPALEDLADIVAAYIAHRYERLEQVRGALVKLGTDPPARRITVANPDSPYDPLLPLDRLALRQPLTSLVERKPQASLGILAERIVELVYSDVPTLVRPAAKSSVMAQLEYLSSFE